MEISEKRCWKGFKRVPGKQPYSKGSCMKESYKLIGKVLFEAGYKGIQFNRFGNDDGVLPASVRKSPEERDRKKDNMYAANTKNVDRVAKSELERQLTLPETKKKMEDALKKSPEFTRDDLIDHMEDLVNRGISQNLGYSARVTGEASSESGKPRLYGFATRGPRGEAFVGRPQKSRIDPKTGKVVEVPYTRRTRQNQREVIGHEAAHVRMSRLPGILSKLGDSEILASAYGGFRAPVRGSSFMSRIRSAGRRVRDYGLPDDLDRIRTSISGMLPSRFRKAQTESYKLIGKVIAEEGLHAWFKNSSSTSGKPGWVQVVSGKPCARQPGQKSTPKCVSSAKRASMTPQERKSAQARKRRMDPNQPSKSGAAKPTYVPTDKPKRK